MNLSLDDLIAVAEGIACKERDGHLTMMRFTSGWKVMFGTPNLDIGGRDEVRQLVISPTLEAALISAIRVYTALRMCKQNRTT